MLKKYNPTIDCGDSPILSPVDFDGPDLDPEPVYLAREVEELLARAYDLANGPLVMP